MTATDAVSAQWFVACSSKTLRAKPLSRQILDTPLVLVRFPSGDVSAFLDRCPHRNVPLSLGRVVNRNLQCAYHGWEFCRHGTCKKIPGLESVQPSSSKNATSFPLREQQGYVWVFMQPGASPPAPPPQLSYLEDDTHQIIRYEYEIQGSLFQILENMLDVPHTAFLHRGLFRSSGVTRIHVKVHTTETGARADYMGEHRPSGWFAKLLAPGGGEVVHYDQFIHPNIAVVDYRVGEALHIHTTAVVTPTTNDAAHVYAVAALRLKLPFWITRTIGLGFARRILKQDAHIVRNQAENVKRFGGEKYAFTPADVLGPSIFRSLQGTHMQPETHEAELVL